MSGFKSVVLVAVAVAIATVAGDRHQQELKEHYDHLAYIAEFNCHHPQPRVIPVHELFPEEDIAHKAFFPDVTVLHRCDNSVGCCPSNHHCRPKHTHSLHLPFKVTYLEHIGKHKKGSWIIDYHTFENHTECECVDASVCVPPTGHEETGSDSHHKPDHHEPDHHSESSHKTEHHGESHHEPDHHSESPHKTEHHGESHHEPDHHSESSHKTEHHSESHHEPDHHSESSHKTEHHEEVHHEEVHVEESHHEPDHHSESSHKTEHHEESEQEIDSHVGSSSYKPEGYSSSSGDSSYKPEDRPEGSSSSPGQESESSTVPLIVDYVYGSSSTSTTTEKAEEKDISSFFD